MKMLIVAIVAIASLGIMANKCDVDLNQNPPADTTKPGQPK